MVKEFLNNPSEAAWKQFRTAYLELIAARFAEDRAAFDALAQLSKAADVYLGCNCPTTLNPAVSRCHTYIALKFMKRKYPSINVCLPKE